MSICVFNELNLLHWRHQAPTEIRLFLRRRNYYNLLSIHRLKRVYTFEPRRANTDFPSESDVSPMDLLTGLTGLTGLADPPFRLAGCSTLWLV